jgi:hypothetical protein
MKMIAFWDIAPCSPVEVDQRFRGVYCLHHQGDGNHSESCHLQYKASLNCLELEVMYSLSNFREV